MKYTNILVMLLLHINGIFSTTTCVLQADGSMPAAGLCSGPIERASLRYTMNNTNCLQDQVAFTKDGGSTWACGSCNPGETGLGYSDIASELALALSLANYDPGTQTYQFQAGALFNCEINEVGFIIVYFFIIRFVQMPQYAFHLNHRHYTAQFVPMNCLLMVGVELVCIV